MADGSDDSSSDEEIFASLIERKSYLVGQSTKRISRSTKHNRNVRQKKQHETDELHQLNTSSQNESCTSSKDPAPALNFDADENLLEDSAVISAIESSHLESTANESGGPSAEDKESTIEYTVSDDVIDNVEVTGVEVVNPDDMTNVVNSLLQEKLYENSDLNVDAAVLKVMQIFADNRGVTKKCLGQFAQVIHHLLPQPNNFPSSKYLLFKYVLDNSPSYRAVKHSICGSCEYYLGLEWVKETKCKACGSVELSYLYEFPLEDIVKHLFEVRQLHKVLTNRQQSEDGSYSDITDGNIYKTFADNMGEFDITLLWNTDGYGTSNSSSAQGWPIQVKICEVKPSLRKHYLIVCGFFFGKSKPVLNSFLRPFVMSLRKICENGGVKWIDPENNVERISMVRAPFASLDAPARAQALNMVSHGGYYACNMCEVEGCVCMHKRGHKVVYPLVTEEPVLRTAAQMREQALQASRSNPINGLYGPSIVSYIPRFDPARGLVNEYMHNTLLGVTRTFASVWLTDLRGDWYISKPLRGVIDTFMCNIFPPDIIKRMPRYLSCWSYWKASEWRLWLLFFSILALLEIWPLENKFVQHWILLVKAIYNLLQSKVDLQSLQEAKDLLKLFVKEIKELYSYRDPEQSPSTPRSDWIPGDWLYTFNIHQLLHLPAVVEDTGPLWSTGAFDFEDNNCTLANLTHGTNNIDTELLNSLQLLESINVLRSKCATEKPTKGGDDMRCNPISGIKLSDDHLLQLRILLQNDELTTSDFFTFSRVVLNGKKTWCSTLWDRPQKRNSYTVRCNIVGTGVYYGEILFFVRRLLDDSPMFCVLKCFNVDHPKIIIHKETKTILKHILPIKDVQDTDKELVLYLKDVEKKVIRVGKYVCVPPNSIEINL